MNYAAILTRRSPRQVRSFRLGNGAGVIVNNAPALRKSLPNQTEHSADVALRAREMPVSEHQRRILAQKTKFKIGEIEPAHRGAIRIVFLVPRSNAVPPARNPAASRKRQLRRMPVALEEGIHVSFIPSLLLRIENRGDRRAVGLPLLLSLRSRGGSDPKRHTCKQQPTKHTATPHPHRAPRSPCAVRIEESGETRKSRYIRRRSE